MGVRITEDGRPAAIYDSVTGLAFGPTFTDEDEADDFLNWWGFKRNEDVRTVPMNDLVEAVAKFRADAEAWGNDPTADDLTLIEWIEREA